MTPEIITRSFSNDQAVFDKVFFDNLYKLKGNKDKNAGKIFVDIGAHAGYFSFLALTLGARKVYSFEPYVDNFNILIKNCYTPNFVGRFTPYQLGVNVDSIIGKFDAPQLIDNIYFDLAGIGLSTKDDGRQYPCRCEQLDEILRTHCFDEPIDVLKINLGYSEREILLGSKLLAVNVLSICGEISANDIQLFEFKKEMGIRGYVNFVSDAPNEQERVVFRASKINLSENFI
jgi:FkbM family methyltransferase